MPRLGRHARAQLGPARRLAVEVAGRSLGGALAGVAGAFLAVPIAIVCSVALAHRRERQQRETAVTVPSAAERAGRGPQFSGVGLRDGHDI